MEVYHNVVYYPNWAARIGKTPGTLKIDAITMIYYAFAQLVTFISSSNNHVVLHSNYELG